MEFTPIPEPELDIFKQLKNIRVVFDAGARTDVDYIKIKPKIELHCFEPNPEFFPTLKENAKNYPKIRLNNYGLGDEEGMFHYNVGLQSFEKSEANSGDGGDLLPVKTLEWYIQENNIKRIDFLKTDTEGYDLKVFKGTGKFLKKIKYLQYEHWNTHEPYQELLGKDFQLEFIGYRNVLCMNKKLVSALERKRLSKYIKEKGYALYA